MNNGQIGFWFGTLFGIIISWVFYKVKEILKIKKKTLEIRKRIKELE